MNRILRVALIAGVMVTVFGIWVYRAPSALADCADLGYMGTGTCANNYLTWDYTAADGVTVHFYDDAMSPSAYWCNNKLGTHFTDTSCQADIGHMSLSRNVYKISVNSMYVDEECSNDPDGNPTSYGYTRRTGLYLSPAVTNTNKSTTNQVVSGQKSYFTYDHDCLSGHGFRDYSQKWWYTTSTSAIEGLNKYFTY